jgi:hypothetical protein
MTQLMLQCAQVQTLFQQVGRVTVPQAMNGYLFVNLAIDSSFTFAPAMQCVNMLLVQ